MNPVWTAVSSPLSILAGNLNYVHHLDIMFLSLMLSLSYVIKRVGVFIQMYKACPMHYLHHVMYVKQKQKDSKFCIQDSKVHNFLCADSEEYALISGARNRA